MVQEFNVVCCYSCQMFQVEQVKKSTNKWSCKICNEKQTLKQVFFRGTGKDCRFQCQERNMKIQTRNIEKEEVVLCKEDSDELDSPDEINIEVNRKNDGLSKWAAFVQSADEDETEEEGHNNDSISFRGEFGSGKKRKSCVSSQKRRTQPSHHPYKTKLNDIKQKREESATLGKPLDRKILPGQNNVFNTGLNQKKISCQNNVFNTGLNKIGTNTATMESKTSEKRVPLNQTPQSKWCNYLTENAVDDDEPLNETTSDGTATIRMVKSPPVIKLSSKWSQFMRLEEEIESDPGCSDPI